MVLLSSNEIWKVNTSSAWIIEGNTVAVEDVIVILPILWLLFLLLVGLNLMLTPTPVSEITNSGNGTDGHLISSYTWSLFKTESIAILPLNPKPGRLDLSHIGHCILIRLSVMVLVMVFVVAVVAYFIFIIYEDNSSNNTSSCLYCIVLFSIYNLWG